MRYKVTTTRLGKEIGEDTGNYPRKTVTFDAGSYTVGNNGSIVFYNREGLAVRAFAGDEWARVRVVND